MQNDDLQDLVSKALRRAWQLGQTYWQQADSDFVSQQKKSDITQARFYELIEETRAALAATPADARDAGSAARFRSQQNFLNWNRAQQTPPVKIAQEYGVFNNAIDLYRAAIAAAKEPTE